MYANMSKYVANIVSREKQLLKSYNVDSDSDVRLTFGIIYRIFKEFRKRGQQSISVA